ncbi:hypothetical protein DOTSEDRAFT_75144 [Dothistroma septosporum NZE10]|uniref:Knr4/Smi1-like domain-containing protein n=1 Tax=Dothistroma septosporum (strain NZE10 / CBS 128990) TaxID=675120 RepID=M2Y211_DOTSN|nr:hypothetical protein DOTSEDRAFT_75144 [Dothistroma septosporum NZE10]
MALQITPEKVKQERDVGQVKRLLRNTAVELAVLGEVDPARYLLSLLASVTGETVSLSQNGLSFAWRATDQWPEGTPDEAKSQDALSKLRQRCVRSGSHNFPRGGDVYDDSGLRALLEVEDVYGADSSTGSSAMAKGVRLVRALEISLTLHYSGAALATEAGVRRPARIAWQTNGKTEVPSQKTHQTTPGPRLAVADLDVRSAEIVGMIADRWTANCQLRYLAEAESLWPYYLVGLLANALSLDSKDLRAKSQALVQAFADRLEHGFAPSTLSAKSMRDILEIAAENTVTCMAQDGNTTSDQIFFKPCVSDEEIEALERRLQTVLPDDYKEFLKTTNGFGLDDTGIYNGYFPDPALYSSAEVKWNSEEYFQLPVDLLELPREIEQLATSHWEERRSHPNGEFDWEGALPCFDRVLEIGTRDIDNIWLVHPQLVEQCRNAYHEMYRKANTKQRRLITLAMESFAGSKEAFEQMHWCCVTWAAGGSACMTAYASFRDYIEGVTMESMERKAE